MVTAVVVAVVVMGAVVVGGAVVMIAVVDVVAAGSTVLSSLPIPLQAPVAHSAAMQVTASPIARPVFLFVIINPSVLVVVVVLRTTNNTTERRDMSIKKSQILPNKLK